MDPTAQGLVLMLLGIFIGAVTMLAWRLSDRQLQSPAEPPTTRNTDVSVVPPGVATVLSVLGTSALVVDENDRVVQSSAPAYALGLVRAGELRVDELTELVRQVRRDGESREIELELARTGRGPTHVHARVAALTSRLVLVLAEDRTRERRVEAVRRDFVANVSHELKTPVGALTLLTEAIREAADDPDAVMRFAARMQREAVRLNRLVQQIIELSRLQNDVAPDRPTVMDVDDVVAKAIDVNAIEAAAKRIEVRYDGKRGLEALGDPAQVGLAMSNLVANAVAYSPECSTVVVSALPHELMVDISVTDQGIGIPAGEIDRIFERFYRVDPARHRSTGGTGLGLSIVKHVAASHGGEVKVWSEEGKGSTFTLRLPRNATTLTPPEDQDQPTPTSAPTPTPTSAEPSLFVGRAVTDRGTETEPVQETP